MNHSHYHFDNQLEPHKAKQREEARQAIVARIEAERKRQADECRRKWAERTQNVLDK